MTGKTKRCLVFSDLDGTLLDQDTYEFGEAREALSHLKKRGIPLILCSSKTRMEMEAIRLELDNRDPFIAENGAAVFIPRGLFGQMELNYKEVKGYEVVELGTPYEKIVDSWSEIKKETALPAKGFSEMSAEQIALATGLTLEKAVLAGKRDYSEPFMLTEETSGERWSLLERAVRKRRLTLITGGRFHHLIGLHDKGKAVRILIRLYHKLLQPLVSIGLGDSLNDFPLLKNVDIPVLIKKKSGEWESWPFPTLVYRSRESGPKGWNAFILELLKENCHE